MTHLPRRPTAPLAVSLLVLLLAGTSVRSQAAPAAAALQTVRASECRAQSIVQDIIFSGCSTIDSPSAGQPWCLLPKAVATDPDVQALCVPDSIPARTARATDTNETVPCDAATTPAGKQGQVFGCFTTVQTAGQLRCSSGAAGLQPCRVNSARTPDAAGADSAASEDSFFSGTLFGLPKLAVFGGIAFVLILIIVAVFFFRRRNASKATSTKRRSLEDPATIPEYKEMPSAPQSPAGPGSPAPLSLSVPVDNNNGGGGGGGGGGISNTLRSQRTSSQYGAGSHMSFANGLSSPVPPMPAPANIEGSLGKFMVSSTYTPTLDDEITIEPGDIVEIFQEFDDGWCSAVNISRGMARGVFPMHCVDEDSRIDD